MTRLDKFLCDNGLGTRKEVKSLIKSGKIKIDGTPVTSPETKFDPDKVSVTLNNAPVALQKFVYIIMNKPKNTVCASTDPIHKTVFDILPQNLRRKDLFTAGRLDIDTTGLLLITNDGGLSHRLLSPKHHAEKEYYVEGEGKLAPNAEALFKEGLTLGKDKLKPARLNIIFSDGAYVKATLTITEGKFHQVKRMFYAAGVEVTVLKRIRFAALSLPADLKEGSARRLTPEEEALLKAY